MQIKVHAEVVNPQDETRETTNDFHFTFNTRTNDVPSVIPKTYAGGCFFISLFFIILKQVLQFVFFVVFFVVVFY